MSKSGKHIGDSNLVKTTFSWSGDGDFVEIRGSFGLPKNPDWKPMALNWSKELEKFYIDLKLEQGKFYQYKFVVDGKWVCDMNSETSIDVNGNLNNIIYVPYLNRNADPEFETEASTEDEQFAGDSHPRARQENYDNVASRRRIASNATQQSGQSYLPSGGQGSTRKMSGSTAAFDDGTSYRQETAYKSGDLQKWEQQESLSRQGQMPRKSSKQFDYSEEYAKQGKREPAASDPRIRVNDGYSRGTVPSEVGPSEHNRRPSQTGSESSHARSRSRGGSFQSSEREIQMEYQSLQPEVADNRGRSYSPSNQVQAPLPGYVYQTRQFMPVGPQLREHEAKRGSLSRSSGIAARHVSFDPATLPENYDSVDASEPEYQQNASRRAIENVQVKGASQMRQPELEAEEDYDMDQRYGAQAPAKEKYLRGARQAPDEDLNPVNARRQGYPSHAVHNPAPCEVSQDFESYPNDSIAPEEYDEQVMQTRSQVKSHRRNRFGQGSAGPAQDPIQGYSDQDSSDAMDFGGAKPPSATPLRYSHQAEEVKIPQSSPRRDSVNSASFPRGRKPSNPSINYPTGAMADNGEELYNGQGYSSKGRQGGSQRLAGSSRPASRLQIPTEFMVAKNQIEGTSYSRNDFNETSESGTDTMEVPYEGQAYSNVYPKKGYPSENLSGRSPGSVGRKGSNPGTSYSPGRKNVEISDRYRQLGFTAAEQGARNDVYADPSANMINGRRRSNTEQEYAETTTRPRRRSKADQYEYAESASGKSAIYFDPVTGKFVRSYATQLVDNAPVNQEYNDVPGGRRRRSNTERVDYYDPSSEKLYSTTQDIDSNRYEARAGRNRRNSVSSQGAHEDVTDPEYHKIAGMNSRSGRRRSSTQQADYLESTAPKSAGILKKDIGAHSATGRSGRGSVSSQGAREDSDDRDYLNNAGGSSRSGRRRPSAQTNSAVVKPAAKGSNATARFDPTTGRFVYDTEPLQATDNVAGDEHEPNDDIKQAEENNVNQHLPTAGNPEPTSALPQEYRESTVEDTNQNIPTSDQVNEPMKPVIGYYDPKLGRFVYATEAPVETAEQEPPSQQAETHPSGCHSNIPDQSTQASIAQVKEETSCADIDPSVGHYDPVAKKFVCGFSHQAKADTENVASSINNIIESKPANVAEDVAAGSGYFDPTAGRFISTPSDLACPTEEGSAAQASASTEGNYQSLNTNDGFSVGLSMLSEGSEERFDNEDKTSFAAPPPEISNEPEESSTQTIASEGASSEEKTSACPFQAAPNSLRRVFDPLSGKFVYTEAPPSNQASASVSRATPAQLSRRTTGLNNYVAAGHSGLGDTENAEVSHDESVYQVSTPAAERNPSGGYFDASTGRFAGARYIPEKKAEPVPIPAPAREPESIKPVAEVASVQAPRYFDADSGKFVTGTAPGQKVSFPVPAKQTSYPANQPASTGVKTDAAPPAQAGAYFDITTGRFINGIASQNVENINKPYAASSKANVAKDTPGSAEKPSGYFDMSTGRFISSPIKAYVAPGAQEPIRSNLVGTSTEAQVDKAASSQPAPYFDPATGKFMNSVVNAPSQPKATVGYFDIKTGKFAVGPQSEPATSDIKDNIASVEKVIYPSNYLESVKAEVTPATEDTFTANTSEAAKADEAPVPGVGYFDVITGRFISGSQATTGAQDGSSQLEVSSTSDTLANAEAEVPSVDTQTPKKKKGSSGKKHSSKSKSKGKSKSKASQSEAAYEKDEAASNLNTNSLVGQINTLRSLENQYPTESDSKSSEESSDEDSQDDPDSTSSASTPQEGEFTKVDSTKNNSLELPLFSKTSLATLIGIYMVASYNGSSKSSGSMLMIIPLIFLLVVCVAVMNASAWIKYSKFGWRCNADMSITLFEDAEDLDSRCVTLTTTNIISILFLGITLISILAMTSVTSFYAVGSMTKEACCSGL